MKTFKISALLALFIFLPAASYAEELNLLSISDIHLDAGKASNMPLDPNGYNPGNDLDKKTYETLIRQIGTYFTGTQKPDFILNLGDAIGHNSSTGTDRALFVKENETIALQTLLKQFPNTPIINVFGNNDSPESNYGKYNANGTSPFLIATEMKQPEYPQTVHKFKDGFLSSGKWCNPSLNSMPCILDENQALGYFSIKLKNNLVLIGLNSIIFSADSWNTATDADKRLQLEWLGTTLSKTSPKDNILIAMHIPVGQNVFDGSIFWPTPIRQTFLEKIAPYTNRIKGVLVGHTHMEEFKIMNLTNGKIGEYFTAGLSTSHGDSPSVKMFTLKQTEGNWAISNYTTYQMHGSLHNIAFSKYYDFADQYCKHIDFKNDINNCLGNSTPTFESIKPWYTVNNPNYPFEQYFNRPGIQPGAFYVNG